MNWLAIVLIVFVAFSWLMTLALCRAARLGDEMAQTDGRPESHAGRRWE